MDEEPEYVNRTIRFESLKVQKQGISTNKLHPWSIKLAGDATERIALMAFQDRHFGDLKSFLFVNPDGVTVEARFASGKLSIKTKRDISGTIVGYEAQITIEKVI